MADDNNRLIRPPYKRLAWSLWVAGFLSWTYLLVVPNDWLPRWLRFGTGGPGGIGWGKLGHMGAYAGLTALAVCLTAETPWQRWAFLGVMSGHAFGTEAIQSL